MPYVSKEIDKIPKHKKIESLKASVVERLAPIPSTAVYRDGRYRYQYGPSKAVITTSTRTRSAEYDIVDGKRTTRNAALDVTVMVDGKISQTRVLDTRIFVSRSKSKPRLEYYNVSAISERNQHYKNENLYTGFHYNSMQRLVHNPEFDDEFAHNFYNIDGSLDEGLAEHITKQYCKLFPEFKAHFENTRFHTPVMAHYALLYPAYAMMLRVGWSPTFANSEKAGLWRTLLNQPNPKRLINYIYGSYSRSFFKHLDQKIMPSYHNWYGLSLLRLGREIAPAEWLVKEIDLNNLAKCGDEILPEERTATYRFFSDLTVRQFNRNLQGIKAKRFVELAAQSCESTANMQLFYDIMNMARRLRNARERQQYNGQLQRFETIVEEPGVNIFEQFNTRYLDELHTRAIEVFNERFQRIGVYQQYGTRRRLSSDTELKYNKKLHEALQNTTLDNKIMVRVAEKVGEVEEWGAQMRHCIATYAIYAVTGSTNLLGFYDQKGRIFANAAVAPNGTITQLRGPENAKVDAEHEDIIRKAVADVFA